MNLAAFPAPPQNPKPVFTSVRDAKAALACDRLGTVYHRVSGVFVVTAFGTATFTREQWRTEA